MKKSTSIFFLALILSAFVSLGVVHAQGYAITTKLPGTVGMEVGTEVKGNISIQKYIQQFFIFSLVVVGVAALAMIVYQGLKYTLSAGNASVQSDARDGIWQAIMGLILLLAAYLILFTINPKLVSLGEQEQDLVNAPTIPEGVWTQSGN